MAVETIREMRSRMRSISSTQKIARAMFLSSSAKLSRMLKRAEESCSFRKQAIDMIGILQPHAAVAEKNAQSCRVVIAGDKGMSGGYNNMVLEAVCPGEAVCWLPVGRKASEKLRRKNAVLLTDEPLLSGKTELASLKPHAEKIALMLLSGSIGSIEIIRANGRRDVITERVYPGESGKESMVFEPQPDEIFKNCFAGLLAGIIYASVCEANACEEQMRRMAMDTAQRNAEKMLEEVKLRLNRKRRAAITREIMEAVSASGAEQGGRV